MKKALVILLLSLFGQSKAQTHFTETMGAIKFGGGYSKDFPGLSGYAVHGEYSYPLHERLEGGFGIKRISMKGYPRTSTVQEYTKATTLDFNIHFLPLASPTSVFRIGVGYSFVFYKIRRSYPVIETVDSRKVSSWPIDDKAGRTSGVMLTGEYEYNFTSRLSLGIKASLCKAYDRIYYVAPFAGIRL